MSGQVSLLRLSLRSRHFVDLSLIRLSLRSKQLVNQSVFRLSLRSRQWVEKSLFLASRFARGNWWDHFKILVFDHIFLPHIVISDFLPLSGVCHCFFAYQQKHHTLRSFQNGSYGLYFTPKYCYQWFSPFIRGYSVFSRLSVKISPAAIISKCLFLTIFYPHMSLSVIFVSY